jgi:hypothetical protein
MAYESAVIEQWIYATLSADATLQNLLAIGNKPAQYQQGIYNTLVPQVDVISRTAPQLPYVVFTRTGSDGQDQDTLCGSRVFTYPNYRITVWNSESGAVSMAHIQDIMSRIDTLLENIHVNSTTPRFYIRRVGSDQVFSSSGGGRTDFGVTAMYRCITQQ